MVRSLDTIPFRHIQPKILVRSVLQETQNIPR